MPYVSIGDAFGSGLQGLQGALGGLGQLSDGASLNALQDAAFRQRAAMAFRTRDTPSYLGLSNIPKTIREELQSEVDEWLKDIDL